MTIRRRKAHPRKRGYRGTATDYTKLVRQLRLAVIQNQVDQGNLTERQGRLLLNGPLTLGDFGTVYLDGHLLNTIDGLEQIEDEYK